MMTCLLPNIFIKFKLDESDEYQDEQDYIRELFNEYSHAAQKHNRSKLMRQETEELRHKRDEASDNLMENIRSSSFYPLVTRKRDEIMGFIREQLKHKHLYHSNEDWIIKVNRLSQVEKDRLLMNIAKKYGSLPVDIMISRLR